MNNNENLRQTIIHGIYDVAYIWIEEFKTIFKDKGAMIFLFFLPLGYPLLYSLIYNPEVPREIPIAVIDNSRTTLSRQYCRMLDGTPQVNIVSYAANMDEAKALQASQQIFGIIELNKDFEKDIVRSKPVNVELYCEMFSLLYYRNILMATTDVTGAFNQYIQEQGIPGATEKQLSMSVSPVKSATISMFNPAGGFATFIMPGVLVLVIQQSLLLAIGLLAGTQREKNKNHHLIPLNRRYLGTLRIIFGKTLCFFPIAVIASFWTMVIVPQIFNFISLAHIIDIAVFMLPFILSSIFLGMTLSCLIRGRELPMLFYVFMSIPLIFLSGISWPWSAIPPFWQWFANLFPSTAAIQGFIQLNSCGATLEEVTPYLTSLWTLTFIYFITTFIVYRYQVKKVTDEIDVMLKDHHNH